MINEIQPKIKIQNIVQCPFVFRLVFLIRLKRYACKTFCFVFNFCFCVFVFVFVFAFVLFCFCFLFCFVLFFVLFLFLFVCLLGYLFVCFLFVCLFLLDSNKRVTPWRDGKLQMASVGYSLQWLSIEYLNLKTCRHAVMLHIYHQQYLYIHVWQH